MFTCVKSLQSCSTLYDPMDSSPPGSSVHGILWARIPEWVVLGVSTGDPTHDKVMRRDLTGKESQVSRGPLSEHLP